MNQGVETRLRDALGRAAETVDPAALRPLTPPRRRARAAAFRRSALVAAAVAAAFAAGAIMLARPADRPEPVAALPDGMALVARMGGSGDDVTVFFCQANSPLTTCSDASGAGRDATDDQVAAVRSKLRGRPEVTSLTFEDRRTAYANFRREYRDTKDLIAAVKVEDMPESLRVLLKPDADTRPVIEAVRDMPGVALVVDQRCLNRVKEESDRARREGRTPPPYAGRC